MRPTLLGYLLVFIVQYGFAQGSYSCHSVLVRKSIITPAQLTVPAGIPRYDMSTINKKLRTMRRCIISGSVLTGVGGALFATAWITTIPSPAQRHEPAIYHSENFLATGLLMGSLPVLGTGLPVLSVGLALRHKWRTIKHRATATEAGLLQDRSIGFAFNF